ncbi:hypothetical protein [Paenibacillus sp. CF384]|uniref:hypothetical protein n=1 Tax=Paenibacillus sp. CF384 TaxID=1884382 RepID=UPI00089D39C6|nr:hypothetical protein [Paenibacillus sp. CF384]SDW86611.1 hypothetical protein SAMN05518855_100671 [Paenibacillus sp. CF384]
MKRYWFSILLVIFILGSIGTYYVGAATRSYPDFNLLTVSGDDNEAKSLVLDGMTKAYGSLVISSKGSTYKQEESYFEQFSMAKRYSYSQEMVQLFKEHHGFMRAKRSSNSFYQDEKTLAYASFNSGYVDRNSKFNIATLDLTTKDEQSFVAAVPNYEQYGYAYVMDVQLDGKMLYVFTVNYRKNADNGQGFGNQEIHKYTVDLNAKSIAKDDVILADKKLDNGQFVRYTMESSTPYNAPNDVLVFRQQTEKHVKDKDGNEIVENTKSELLTMNWKSGQTTEVPAVDPSISDYWVNATTDSIIVIVKQEKSALVKHYDLKTREIKELVIPVQSLSSSMVSGDRLYLMSKEADAIDVVIADLKQSKVVYTGKIDINKQGAERTKLLNDLQIYSMYVIK